MNMAFRVNVRAAFWSVAGRGIYSSARNVYVAADDADLVGWQAAGGVVHSIANEADLWAAISANAADYLPGWLFDGETFAQPSIGSHSSTQLRAYAAMKRFAREVGGVVFGQATVRTDRESQALINGAYSAAVRDPSFVTRWKVADGTFASLDAEAISTVAGLVAAHVAASFAIEAHVSDQISAGVITSVADVDAAFA